MKNLITTITLIFLIFNYSFPQAPDTMWTKTFGGIEDDVGYSVEQTNDGGYIITGVSSSFGELDGDLWLIKTDSEGATIWTKVYGGLKADLGRSVKQTTDGGYIITGTYGPGLAGGGITDLWLLKTDSFGDTLWTRVFKGSFEEEGFSVKQTVDGGYIVVGYTTSFSNGFHDVWLLKTDANGDTVWTKTYGDTGWKFGKDVEQTLDGGYIVVAQTSTSNGLWLLKTDVNGDTVWTKHYGGHGNNAHAVLQTTDGGFVILGELLLSSTYVWLIKTDSEGDSIWTQTYGGMNFERGYSIDQTSDSGYIIAGKIQSNVWILKINAVGETIWSKSMGDINGDVGYYIQQTSDGGYIIVGSTYSTEKKKDIWLIKLVPDAVGIENEIYPVPISFNLKQNYPNPFNPSTIISWQSPVGSWQTLKIYDVLGNGITTLADEFKPAGRYEVEWDASGFPSGVYFYQLQSNNFIETKRMLLLK